MVEYTRLLNGDWLRRTTQDWSRHDTVVLTCVLMILAVVGYLVTRKN